MDKHRHCSPYAQNCEDGCCDVNGDCPKYSKRSCHYYYNQTANSSISIVKGEKWRLSGHPQWPVPSGPYQPYDESVWIIVYVLGGFLLVMAIITIIGLVFKRRPFPLDLTQTRFSNTPISTPIQADLRVAGVSSLSIPPNTVLTQDGRRLISQQRQTVNVKAVSPLQQPYQGAMRQSRMYSTQNPFEPNTQPNIQVSPIIAPQQISVIGSGSPMIEQPVKRQPLPSGVTLFQPPHLAFSREQPEDAYLPTLAQASKLMPLTTSNVYLGKGSPVIF